MFKMLPYPNLSNLNIWDNFPRLQGAPIAGTESSGEIKEIKASSANQKKTSTKFLKVAFTYSSLFDIYNCWENGGFRPGAL